MTDSMGVGPVWTPTRKWFAARAVALAGLATMWATTGSWDQEETLAAITIVSSAAVAWLIPNNEETTP